MIQLLLIFQGALLLLVSVALYRAISDIKRAYLDISKRLLYIEESLQAIGQKERASSIYNDSEPMQEATLISWDDSSEYWQEVEDMKRGR